MLVVELMLITLFMFAIVSSECSNGLNICDKKKAMKIKKYIKAFKTI